MAMKDFNFKQFLLEKGERVGLYAAGGIALLMIVLSLFWPHKGLLSDSPKASAEAITKVAKDKKDQAGTAGPGTLAPSDAEKKNLREVDPQLQKQAGSVAQDPNAFRMLFALFAPRDIPSNKRQNPSILGPEEFAASVWAAQISNYMVKNDRGEVFVGILRGSGKQVKRGKNDPFRIGDIFNKGGKPGPGGGMPPGFNPNNRGTPNGFAPPSGEKPGSGGVFGDGDKKNLEVNWVRKDEVPPDATFARDLLPKRMVIVAGSFPFRKQVELFQRALRLENASQVVQETLTEKDNKKGQDVTLAGFRFVGFEVQRKTIGPDGQVVLGPSGSEWQAIDFESPDSEYRALRTHVLFEDSPENPELAQLLWPGLYMPRPVQIPLRASGSKPYPDVEKELPKIQQTLTEVAAKEPPPVVARTKFDMGSGDFNAFGPQETPPEGPERAAPASGQAQEWTPPSYSVLRFLDVTIQPGRTYEYRVLVKMANPNYNNPETEVANPALAKWKELRSDWYPVKGPDGQALRVRVPDDLHYYAVDELTMLAAKSQKEAREWRGMNWNVPRVPFPDRQAVVQLHVWKDQFELTRGSQTVMFPVGDWIVGERLFAFRGEYVGLKKVHVHVPVWSPEQSTFYLAGRQPRTLSRDMRPTEEMSFLDIRKAPILLDFEGGTASYHRGGAPPPPKGDEGTTPDGAAPAETSPSSKATPVSEVKQAAASELVFLTPEGKLVAHSSAQDEDDQERKEREESYSRRVAETDGRPEVPGK